MKFSPYLGKSISLSCAIVDAYYLSIGRKASAISWMLCSCYCGGIFLVDEGFTCYLLELVRNFLHIVVGFKVILV
jgi:hypothetical protein